MTQDSKWSQSEDGEEGKNLFHSSLFLQKVTMRMGIFRIAALSLSKQQTTNKK
jgi:hypothetical protein